MGDEGAHAELARRAPRPAIVRLGLADVGRIGMRGDVAEEAKRPRLDSPARPAGGQVERAAQLRAPRRAGPAARQRLAQRVRPATGEMPSPVHVPLEQLCPPQQDGALRSPRRAATSRPGQPRRPHEEAADRTGRSTASPGRSGARPGQVAPAELHVTCAKHAKTRLYGMIDAARRADGLPASPVPRRTSPRSARQRPARREPPRRRSTPDRIAVADPVGRPGREVLRRRIRCPLGTRRA